MDNGAEPARTRITRQKNVNDVSEVDMLVFLTGILIGCVLTITVGKIADGYTQHKPKRIRVVK